MAGVESPSNASTGYSLRNVDTPAESMKKCKLENNSSDYPSRRKYQKVSAIRDFPESCGRFAQKINGKVSSLGTEIIVNLGSTESLKSSECSVQVAFPNSLEISNSETNESQMILDQNELHKPLLKSPKHEISSNLPHPQEGESKSLDRCHAAVHPVEDKKELIGNRYPLRRRISSNRDFPYGCGRKAPSMNKGECLKVIASSSSKSKEISSGGSSPSSKIARNVNTGKNVSRFEGENTRKISLKIRIKTSQLSPTSHSVSERVGKEVVVGQHKVGEESAGPRKDQSSNRKSMGQLEDCNATESESQGNGIMGFASFDDETMVQVPIGVANCPWGLGKQQSDTISVRSAVARHILKKDNGAFRWETKSFNGIMATKKSLQMETGASQESHKTVIKDEDSSLLHDQSIHIDPESHDQSTSILPLVLPNSSGKGHDARHEVREVLRLFQATFRKLLRGEEAKLNGQGQTIRRIDLVASKLLKDRNRWLNPGKPIVGTVPGVEVGDEFHYRVELSIVGLHRPFQSGIDYVKVRGRILATSVVASGGYADEMDDIDMLIYSGQGGAQISGDKLPKDQKLERGNLALKNSIDAKKPVRVIRGFKELKCCDSHSGWAKSGMTLTYYGLYWVEKFWQEKGSHGFSVFKFQLRRMSGQSELSLKEVKESKTSAVREGLCASDISLGKEKIPICAVNTIDGEHPLPFTYRAKMVYPLWFNPTSSKGCDCTNGCLESQNCICVMKNGGEIPYNHNGAIVEAKPLVYECGPSCKCPPSCYNRVSQHGIRFRLEIFKTKTRGWGVRSLSSIPSGSFICEYTGELLDEKEAEQRTGNDEYLFDIGRNYNDHSLIPNLDPSASCEVEPDSGFTIDAAHYGSVGRFINHSCSPNLYAQNVLYDHDDKRLPHIMLFAVENIPPLQELMYDYNYKIGEVHDLDGNVKEKKCYCGSHECRGRMY